MKRKEIGVVKMWPSSPCFALFYNDFLFLFFLIITLHNQIIYIFFSLINVLLLVFRGFRKENWKIFSSDSNGKRLHRDFFQLKGSKYFSFWEMTSFCKFLNVFCLKIRTQFQEEQKSFQWFSGNRENPNFLGSPLSCFK